jgi:gluconolactonase
MFRTDDYAEPKAQAWTELPPALRRNGQRSAWADANRGGEAADSFLEGPCHGADGELFVVDIPWGRVLRVGADGSWQVVAEYDGWPNGCKRRPDGMLLLADYRRGLVRVDPQRGRVSDHLPHRHSEGFKGLNDLHLAADGAVWFTDQGQTGLHDPGGRVYRLAPDGGLHTVMAQLPSPNGLALAPDGKALFVAMTRDAAVWRAALMPDGNVGKVGRFASFFGATGPDGIAFDPGGRLWVAHPSGDCVWVLAPSGEIARRVRLPPGAFPTNLSLGADGSFVITASGTGSLYRVAAAV